MFPLGVQLFRISIILAIIKVKHATVLQNNRGVLFERDMTYGGILPNDESFYIKYFKGVGRTRCCIICQYNRPKCTGVLYNRKKMKCKLLKRYLAVTDNDGNSSHEEWEYLRITGNNDQDHECKRTTLGWDYQGKINVTKSGRTCQAWASNTSHSPVVGTDLPENYCRNPDDEETPWCYTTDPDVRFELCDIPMYDTPPLDCITSHDPIGISFFGKQNVADTGDLCQKWDSQSPHSHSYPYLDDQDNYCRNPDGVENALWCYTINPNKRWSECIIPRC